MSKTKVLRLLLIVWIIISIVLFVLNIYGIINLMVSYKYAPSDDILLAINILKEFVVYLFFSIMIIIFCSLSSGKNS